MKSIFIAAWLPFLSHAAERASGIGPDMLPESANGAVAESVTDEQLIAKRAAAIHHAPLPKALPPQPQSFGLLEMSTILQSGPHFLLLPKGCVLWCPASLKTRIVANPSGHMSEWQAFLTANRNWITNYEVASSQVTGKSPIPPEALEHFSKGNSIVIATMNGRPITVIQSPP